MTLKSLCDYVKKKCKLGHVTLNGYFGRKKLKIKNGTSL